MILNFVLIEVRVVVLLLGNLGSHATSFDSKTFKTEDAIRELLIQKIKIIEKILRALL